jgi:hypothetical protein
VDDGALVLSGTSHSQDIALALLPLLLSRRWRHRCIGIVAVALAPLGNCCHRGGGVIADVTLALLGHHCHRGAGIIAGFALSSLPLLLSRRWRHHGAGNSSRGTDNGALALLSCPRVHAVDGGGGTDESWALSLCPPPARWWRLAWTMVFLALWGTPSLCEEDSFGGAEDGALALAFFAPCWRDVNGGGGADNSLALSFCPRLHDGGVDDGPLVLLGAPCLPDSGGGVDDGASALSSCPLLEQCRWWQRGG